MDFVSTMDEALAIPHCGLCLSLVGTTRLRTKVCAIGILAWTAACGPAAAQAVRVTPEVDAGLTYSSNAAYSTVASPQSDWIATVSPRLTIASRGGKVRLNGALGLEAVGYANRTLDSVVRPRGSLDGQAELIDRLLFLEGSVVLARASAEPYAPTPESTTGLNDYTEARYRVSPYLQGALSPTVNFLARSDVFWSERVGYSSAVDPGSTSPERDATVVEHRVVVDRRPVPFGFSAEARHQQTEYQNAAAAVLSSTSARLVLLYSPDPQWRFGLVAGYEENEYLLVDRRDPISGLRLRWVPDERTNLSVDIENRFFGTGFDIDARTRSPFFGLQFRATRALFTQPGSHLVGSSGQSAAGLLDSILTTRYPDSTQRNALVSQLIRNLGLPETLVGPVDLYTNYAQTQESVTASILFYGRLTTVTLTGFAQQLRRLVGVEDSLAASALSSDNRQYGAEAVAARRISPTTTIDATLRHTRINGLAGSGGEQTRSNLIRAGIHKSLTPSTTANAFGRHQWASSVAGGSESEYALGVGINHRF